MIKADLHIHTNYSADSEITLDKLIERCSELKLDCIAVSDHNTTEGALKLRQMAPFKVIAAEEILTPSGEIMGLFLKETIPGGLSVVETIKRIRAQDGLVCIPHPFDRFRPSALQLEALNSIAKDIDLVEVYNARTIPIQQMSRPKAFAREHRLLMGAGSDAHTLAEVGRAYVTMPDFDGPHEFLKAMAQAEINGDRANPLIYAGGLVSRLRRKLVGRH